MKKVLVVVDMQRDFTYGALRNEEAIKIIPGVAEKVKEALSEGVEVIFTFDTHEKDYLKTEEGKNLPVEHCVRDTEGWKLVEELESYAKEGACIVKDTFGSVSLGKALQKIDPDEIELIGICTDICVISNALLSKAFCPNAHIKVDAALCAGVTKESHHTALEAMKACHIEVVGGENG